MVRVGGQEIRETDSLGFQQTHSTNQGPQFGFEGSFCERGLPRELGEFYIATIGGGVRGGDGGGGGRSAGGSGRRAKVGERRGGRGGGNCGSSGGEIGGRGRGGGGGGGTGVSSQALEDGSSGCEGVVRASHCALLCGHEYIDGERKKRKEKREEKGEIIESKESRETVCVDRREG